MTDPTETEPVADPLVAATPDTDPASAHTDAPSRRDRLRAELVADIRAEARRQLDTKGPQGVSWRAIARAVGMSPASLYTYFESLDALYTDLITESFHNLAEAVGTAIGAAADRHIGDRLMAALHGYREWSRRHPEQFRLIFQSAIPGYEAPDDGPTLQANLEVSAHFLGLLVEGWRSGSLTPAMPGAQVDPADMNDKFGLDLSPDEVRVALAAWSTFHGLVQLELNWHINPNWCDVDQVFDAVMRDLGSRVGAPAASDDIAELVRSALDRGN